ncbi:hypothetical protein MtrunA17_Chr1g0197611 [Medicago truncatula]|uniref:Uncharacterized protein n=1 Tax=Medicago truncatula TaxID=3880 RepID=A0A396JSL9_MEDTR|nr:hypothetical protein MtrunA17_Chr1g0197611 [Medicago truncatula]
MIQTLFIFLKRNTYVKISPSLSSLTREPTSLHPFPQILSSPLGSLSLSHSESLLHLHEISHTLSTLSSLQQSPLILSLLHFSVHDSLSREIECLFDGVTYRLNIYHYFLLWMSNFWCSALFI